MLTPSDAYCENTATISFKFMLIFKQSQSDLLRLSVLQVATESKFTNLKPHTAFLFPGQGAQTVGMAKVHSLVFLSASISTFLCGDNVLACLVVQRSMPMVCRMLWRRYLQPKASLLRPLTSWATTSSRSVLRVSHAYITSPA